ncbi:hypothetical protein [Myroides odoratimimus]|uniref:hypothetical protein n=1 Tax=Myroides odoratimimus TaxID=76832 RepID=UPI0025789435|nr:hypothetical protein [Myroides odoratimimus]MDM1328658.1 hypothetical protein [Myroides odoratimimus]
MTSLLTYFIIKLWVSYFYHFYKTKLERVNTKTKFLDDKTQRFRVFFYAFFSPLALVLLFLFVQVQISHDWFEPLYTSLLFIVFLYCMWFLNFTWSDRFQEHFFSKTLNDISKEKNKTFKITNYNIKDLKNLYNNLINQDFIEIIDSTTDINDTEMFAETLFNGKLPESPIFQLSMDNIQTKYFWDKLSVKSENFTLDIFLQIFKNNNSNTTRKSIEVSASKAQNSPKRKKEIDQCFFFSEEG